MASQPQQVLPLFYNDLVPLSSIEHARWRIRAQDSVPHVAGAHAIPVTVDEFTVAQRNFPIIFSTGDNPVPLILMALNEGMNTFVGDDGKFTEQVYVPAYVRRYPFLLAKLRPDVDELSLCFDPTSEVIGQFDEGEPLFEAATDGEAAKPGEPVNRILQFCEQFEQAGARTGQFMADLVEHKLLMDGEVAIQIDAQTQPFVYRGFQMVDETKLRDLRGDVLRKMMQSGMLPLIHAHLFSLSAMEELFRRQAQQGKLPGTPIPIAANAVPDAGRTDA